MLVAKPTGLINKLYQPSVAGGQRGYHQTSRNRSKPTSTSTEMNQNWSFQ